MYVCIYIYIYCYVICAGTRRARPPLVGAGAGTVVEPGRVVGGGSCFLRICSVFFKQTNISWLCCFFYVLVDGGSLAGRKRASKKTYTHG